MACHEGGWMQKRNHEEGRQGAQLEKEQQHLGQNKKAARQRQDRGQCCRGRGDPSKVTLHLHT